MERVTLHSLVGDAGMTRQDRSAVIFDNGSNQVYQSYGNMFSMAVKIQKLLSQLAVECEVVGVCLQMDCNVPAVLLGIVQSCCSFYNFDADSVEFVTSVLQELHARVLLVDIHYLQKLESAITTLRGEVTPNILADCPGYALVHLRAIPARCNDHNLAYCITTSGTTGHPKVVRVPHRCIVPNITHIREIFGLTPDDIVFLSSPLTFDPSIVEMFTTLSVGACLLIVPPELKAMPDRLLDILYTRNKVSVMQATPALLFSLNPDSLPVTLLSEQSALRVLSLGGERFPACARLRGLRSHNNRTQFYNLYGTTEVSCWATWYKVTDTDIQMGSEIPVGVPLLHTTVKVLDRQGKPVTDGVGEIYIGGADRQCIIGPGESLRYNADNIKLRATGDVARVTENGIFYVGRTDSQVKRHGKRINLDEIKTVAETLPNVQECSAHLIDNTLVLFLTKCHPTEDNTTTSGAMIAHSHEEHIDHNIGVPHMSGIVDMYPDDVNDRKFMKTMKKNIRVKLPPHCVPDSVLKILRFPMTKHGKMDKERLVKFYEDSTSKSWSAVKLSLEEFVTFSWKNLLGMDTSSPIPGNSMFITSGGNSFKAVQLHNQIESYLNTSLPNLLDVILHKPFRDLISFVMENKEINVVVESLSSNFDDTCNSFSGDCKETFETDICKHEIPTLDEESKYNENKPGTTSEGIAEDTESNRDKTSHENKIKQTVNTEHMFSSDHLNGVCNHGSNVVLKRKLGSVDECSIMIPETDIKDIANSGIVTTISRGNPGVIVSQFLETGESLMNERQDNIVDEMMSAGSTGLRYRLELVWRYNTRKCVDASPLIAVTGTTGNAPSVYIGSHSHRFCSLSLTTGECLWETTVADRIESSACLSNCGKYVIVGCYDGNVYVFLSETGDIWWKCQTGAEVKSSPVVDMATGLMYIGSHSQHVYALNIQSKMVVWERHLQSGSIFSSPAISYNPHHLYVATLGGKLFSLHHDTGALAWSYACRKPLFSSPCVTGYGVCIGCTDMALYCLGFHGELMWKFDTGGPIFSSPVVIRTCNFSRLVSDIACRTDLAGTDMVHSKDGSQRTHGGSDKCLLIGGQGMDNRVGNIDECLVFGSHDSCLYCVASSGRLRWRVKVDSHVYSTPFPVVPIDTCKYNGHGNVNIRKETDDDVHIGFSNKSATNIGIDNVNMCPHIPIRDSVADMFLKKMKTDEIQLTTDKIKENTCVTRVMQVEDLVVFASTRGTVYVVDGTSGERLCSYELPGEVFSSPVLYHDIIFVGCRDDFVYALKIVKNKK